MLLWDDENGDFVTVSSPGSDSRRMRVGRLARREEIWDCIGLSTVIPFLEANGKLGDTSRFGNIGAPMLGVEGLSKGESGVRLEKSGISVVGVVGVS